MNDDIHDKFEDDDYFIFNDDTNFITNKNKMVIYVRSSLVASLIGKSQYNKYYEAFIKLLKMNKFSIYNDSYEFDDMLKNSSPYEIDILTKKYNNIFEIQEQIYKIQRFNYSESIIEKYKKYIICSFGKQNELNVLNTYLANNNQNIVTNDIKNKEFMSKNIFEGKYFDIVLSGTPDYVDQDNNIIEIKNRIHAFSKSIKECDHIQLQIYLNMFNTEKGKLVEGMIYSENDIKLNSFDVTKDENIFNNIKECVIRICILLYFLIKDEQLYETFNSKNNIDKSNFIVNNMKKINKYFFQNDIDNIDNTHSKEFIIDNTNFFIP